MKYFIELYRDIKLWLKFKSIAKENETYLNQKGLRVDNLGRIYTVINVPDEYANNNQEVLQGYVLQQLKPFNEILLNVGLSSEAVPELRRINDKQAFAYLVLLYPELNNINLGKFTWNLLKLGGYYLILRIIYNIINSTIGFDVIFDFIKKYI